MADWLAAIDDGLTARLWHCTACGQSGPGFFDVCLLDDGRAVGCRICTQCHREDPHREKLAALLMRRYTQAGGKDGAAL